MTTDTTDSSTDAADAIRQNLEAASDRIRRRTELTPEARRTLLAKAHTAAKTQMDSLQTNEATAAKKNLSKLTKTAFGVDDLAWGANPADKASTAISARDAADRAEQLTDPRSASALLARAEATGDETLARAIAQKAHSSGWNDVLQAFIADRPKQAEAVNALREMDGATAKPTIATMFRYVVPAASELGNLGDYGIGHLANGAPVDQT